MKRKDGNYSVTLGDKKLVATWSNELGRFLVNEKSFSESDFDFVSDHKIPSKKELRARWMMIVLKSKYESLQRKYESKSKIELALIKSINELAKDNEELEKTIVELQQKLSAANSVMVDKLKRELGLKHQLEEKLSDAGLPPIVVEPSRRL